MNNPNSLSEDDRAELVKQAQEGHTKATHLERVFREDPKWEVGSIVEFNSPTSFTSVALSEGKSAGNITYKSSDEALAFIEKPTRGLDVPYDKVKTSFNAKAEKETIVAGKYRVSEVKKITEPGTNPQYGYKIPAYVLKEV